MVKVRADHTASETCGEDFFLPLPASASDLGVPGHVNPSPRSWPWSSDGRLLPRLSLLIGSWRPCANLVTLANTLFQTSMRS